MVKEVTHICDLPERIDTVRIKYGKNNLKHIILRTWYNITLINEQLCRNAQIHIRSYSAVQRERQRHLETHPAIIHPYSFFRLGWQFFITLLFLMQAAMIPITLAAVSIAEGVESQIFTETSAWIWTLHALSILSGIDFVMNCCTGVYDGVRKEIILTPKMIMWRYCKAYMIVDLLSTLPTEQDYNVGKLVRVFLDLLSMAKMLRFFKIITYINDICKVLNVRFEMWEMLKLGFIILVFWHFVSCVHVYAWSAETIVLWKTRHSFFKYFAGSYYHGSLIVHTSSYGRKTPGTEVECWLVTISWYIAKFVKIYLIAKLYNLIKARNSSKLKYHNILVSLNKRMKAAHLPIPLQKRILDYYAFHFNRRFFNEKSIMTNMSVQLKQDILIESCRQLVESVPFFKKLPFMFMLRIAYCLKAEDYLEGDIIVSYGVVGNCMYFISTGSVAVYSGSGKEICHLEDGDFFGEVSLLADTTERIATVIALENCQLYRLDRRNFFRAINPNPDMFDEIKSVALQRYEETKTFL